MENQGGFPFPGVLLLVNIAQYSGICSDVHYYISEGADRHAERLL